MRRLIALVASLLVVAAVAGTAAAHPSTAADPTLDVLLLHGGRYQVMETFGPDNPLWIAAIGAGRSILPAPNHAFTETIGENPEKRVWLIGGCHKHQGIVIRVTGAQNTNGGFLAVRSLREMTGC